MVVSDVVLYPCAAIVAVVMAAAYVWFTRPGLIIFAAMRLSLYSTGLRLKYIRAGSYRFCYGERGTVNDKPSLVLIHGFSASKDMWVPIVKKVPRDVHVIVVDLPGHGDTTVPQQHDTEFAFVKYAEYLHEFVNVIGLDKKPFHLVGTSMGGAIAGLYGSEYPGDLDRLTLVCPAMRTPVETDFQKEIRAGKCRLLPETEDEFQEMIHACSVNKVNLNRQILTGVLQLRKPKAHFYTRLFADIMEVDNSPLGRELEEKTREIHIPTQVIWGKQDELIHVSGAEVLRERLPQCSRVDLIDNCGHTCNMDRPGMVTKCLMEFRKEGHRPKTD